MQVNGMLLEGKKVYVGPFLKRQERPDDGEVRFTNVYVKNMAETVTDEKLNEMFSEFGEVTSAIVMKVRCASLKSEPSCSMRPNGTLSSMLAISLICIIKLMHAKVIAGLRHLQSVE